MRKVFLVRHGETDWNVKMRFQGREDVPLNELGISEARLLSRCLKDARLEAVFSSPLLRARKTAEIVAFRHGFVPRVVVGLQEIDFGKWEGLTYDDLDEVEKERLSLWLNNPTGHDIPGGEPFRDFWDRIWSTYDCLLQKTDGNIAVVTHAGAIKVLVAGILKMPLSMVIRLKLSPGSLTTILYDSWGNPYLESFNDTCHLRKEPKKV